MNLQTSHPTLAPPGVAKWQFEPDDLIGIGPHNYAFVETIAEGHVFARLDNLQLHETFSHADIERWRATSGFRHIPKHFSKTNQRILLKTDITYLSELEPGEQSKIQWKKEFCNRFLQMKNAGHTTSSDAKMAFAIANINAFVSKMDCAKKVIHEKRGRHEILKVDAQIVERNPPSPKTLRKWLRDLRDSDFDLRILRDGRRRSGNRNRLDPDLRALLVRTVTDVCGATDERRSSIKLIAERMEILVRDLNAKRATAGHLPWKTPCYKTISKEVHKVPKFDRCAGHQGIDRAKKLFPSVSMGFDVTRPLQRVEIDELKIPLQTLMVDAGAWEHLTDQEREEVKRVRMWVCAAIDVASRCILGMHLAQTPTSDLAMTVLKMIVSDKAPYTRAVNAQSPWDMMGTPHLIVSDGGSALVSTRVQTAITDLIGGAAQPPAGCPQQRPFIERVFGTVGSQLLGHFTGQTFANVVAKGDYDSEARASLTVDELADALVRYVVDIYHNSGHEGLGGETPRNAWLRLTKDFPVLPPPDIERHRAIFGTEILRKLGPRGVEFATMYYQSEVLQQHFRDVGSMDVRVRVDTDNIRRVSVKLGEVWHAVARANDDLEQLTFDDVQRANADLKRRYGSKVEITHDIRLDAIRDIQSMNENAAARIGSTIYSSEALDRAEKEIMLGFTMPDPEADWPVQPAAKTKDILARGIPTGGNAELSPPHSAPLAKKRYEIRSLARVNRENS